MKQNMRYALAFAFFISAVLAAIIFTSPLSSFPRVIVTLLLTALAFFAAYRIVLPTSSEIGELIKRERKMGTTNELHESGAQK